MFSPDTGAGGGVHQVREQVVFTRYRSRRWCFHQVREQAVVFSSGTGAGGVFTRYGSRRCFYQVHRAIKVPELC